jgi:hypothetical protein
MSNASSSSISGTTIERWLKDMEAVIIGRIDEPGARFNFEIQYPPGTPNRLSVIGPVQRPRAVIVAGKIAVSPEHQRTFHEIDPNARNSFLKDLSARLTTDFAEFVFHGMTATSQCPTTIEVSACRYDDGLTLDSFARTVSSVFKAELVAIQCVREHLQRPGFSGGFDFQHIGGAMQ